MVGGDEVVVIVVVKLVPLVRFGPIEVVVDPPPQATDNRVKVNSPKKIMQSREIFIA